MIVAFGVGVGFGLDTFRSGLVFLSMCVATVLELEGFFIRGLFER